MGNKGVDGGNEKAVNAIDGWAMFVVSESYMGVAGGSAVGGAGSLYEWKGTSDQSLDV